VILKIKKNNNRYLRVCETIKKAVSEVLVRNDFPTASFFKIPLSVIKLEMSPDLKNAYVYISSYDEISNEDVLEKIEQSRDFIAKEVVKLIELKFSPKLIFRLDESMDNFDKINNLLATSKVQNDLKKISD
tara:strand:- start:197 stop:589 length:393 start_codon:yes stop_codon:yes gene_type:complete